MIPKNIDFIMRGGNNPDKVMDMFESKVAEEAFSRVNTSSVWSELGYKRAYNLLHLFTFYMSRNPDIIKTLYRLEPYPSYVEMEVTQKCPLRCVFCEHTYWDEGYDELSFKNFKYAMDQFPDLKWAGNNALGDPFTNKDYWRMGKLMDDRGVCQEVYTTTFLLKETDMKKYAQMKGFIFFKISMDGATKETYEKVRPGVDYDKVVRNIKAFDYYKKKYNKHYPELHFHYLIIKENIHEALDYLDFIDSLDVNVGGVMYSRLLHYFPEIKNSFMEIPRYLCNELVEKGKKLNIPVSFNADLPETKAPASECTAWLMPYIFPDGTVISCCCMNEQNRRQWQRETKMGNIFDTPMREIWNGKAYKKMRKMLWQKKVRQAHPVCNMCNIYDIDKKSAIRRY